MLRKSIDTLGDMTHTLYGGANFLSPGDGITTSSTVMQIRHELLKRKISQQMVKPRLIMNQTIGEFKPHDSTISFKESPGNLTPLHKSPLRQANRGSPPYTQTKQAEISQYSDEFALHSQLTH